MHLRDRDRQHAGAAGAARPAPPRVQLGQAVGVRRPRSPRAATQSRELAHDRFGAACRRPSSRCRRAPRPRRSLAPVAQQQRRARRSGAAGCRRCRPCGATSCQRAAGAAPAAARPRRCPPAPRSAATAAGPGARRRTRVWNGRWRGAWSWQEIRPQSWPRDDDGHRHRRQRAHVAHVLEVHRRDAAQRGEATGRAAGVRPPAARQQRHRARSWRRGSARMWLTRYSSRACARDVGWPGSGGRRRSRSRRRSALGQHLAVAVGVEAVDQAAAEAGQALHLARRQFAQVGRPSRPAAAAAGSARASA